MSHFLHYALSALGTEQAPKLSPQLLVLELQNSAEKETASETSPNIVPVLNIVVVGHSPGAETRQDGGREQEASFL